MEDGVTRGAEPSPQRGDIALSNEEGEESLQGVWPCPLCGSIALNNRRGEKRRNMTVLGQEKFYFRFYKKEKGKSYYKKWRKL